jgi:hypothetical protein
MVTTKLYDMSALHHAENKGLNLPAGCSILRLSPSSVVDKWFFPPF